MKLVNSIIPRSQMQECSLKDYRDESLSRKTQCKKAVAKCKTAAVRFYSNEGVGGIGTL